MSDSPGTRLRAAREARKMSVEDITSITKMRPSIIQALEADDYTKFPSITHARNFLSLYGKFLKVDIKDGLGGLAKPRRISVENHQYLNVVRYDDSSFRTQRRNSVSNLGNAQNPRTLGIIALVVAFLFFAVYLTINMRRLKLASSSEMPAAAEVSAPLEISPPAVSEESAKIARPSVPAPEPTPGGRPFYVPVLESRRLVKPHPRPRF